jgi:ribonuclease P protein subunit RPR2
MGKKAKDNVPNPNSITNRDIIQRLNFLYQASVYLHGVRDQPKTDTPRSPGSRMQRRQRARTVTTADLARNYVQSMKVTGKKTLVKM